MDKINLMAEEAKQISITIGKKWIIGKIFKEISSAAAHGDGSIIWDFESSKNNKDEILHTLRNHGYYTHMLDDDGNVVEISW